MKQVLEGQNERGGAGAGGSAQPAAFPWRAKNWLESLDIVDIIADALLEPLKAEARETTVLEEEYIKALGMHLTAHPIVNLIEQSVQRLGTAIHKAAKRHARKGFAADNMCLGNQTTSKFFEAQSGTESGAGLQYGDVSHFSMGLDGFLGPPNPLLRDSMAAEHCDSSDSGTPFKVKNYGTVTTPQLEYYFVVDPSEERLHSLGYETWPTEPVLAEAASVDPEEVRRKQRKALPMKEFESKLAKVNGKLRDKSVEPLQDEEFHGSRLCAPSPPIPPHAAAARGHAHARNLAPHPAISPRASHDLA